MRAAILQQLANINPTLPRENVKIHDTNKKPTESAAITLLYL